LRPPLELLRGQPAIDDQPGAGNERGIEFARKAYRIRVHSIGGRGWSREADRGNLTISNPEVHRCELNGSITWS
jgi:hypothetical protein